MNTNAFTHCDKATNLKLKMFNLMFTICNINIEWAKILKCQ